MSIEVLLLLVIFFVLPLIEQLVRNRRRRQTGAGPQAPRPPAPQRPPPKRHPAGQPHRDAWDEEEDEGDIAVVPAPPRAPTPPPVPAPRPQPQVRQVPRPPVLRAPKPREPLEVLLARRARAATAPFLAPGPEAAKVRRRHALVPELRERATLRRAVVLAAVLGRCRAIDPYEGPDWATARR
jgi:hypothetical protein